MAREAGGDLGPTIFDHVTPEMTVARVYSSRIEVGNRAHGKDVAAFYTEQKVIMSRRF